MNGGTYDMTVPTAEHRLRLLVQDDCHLEYRSESDTWHTVMGGDFYSFASGFDRFFDDVTLAMPVVGNRRSRPTTPIDPLHPRVSVLPLTEHWSMAGYLRRLPRMAYRNGISLWRGIKSSHIVFLRLPSQNGALAYALARLLKRPVVVAVVADVRAVNQTRRGRSRFRQVVRRLGVWADWQVTCAISRRSLTFAYGRGLFDRLQSHRGPGVINSFSSLVQDDELVTDLPAVKETRLVYVGRLASEKGLEDLFEALRRLPGRSVRVRVDIVGDGPLRKELTHLASELSCQVEFHGYVPHGPQLLSLITAATALVLPSRSEGIPKVLLLAMARGTPCIATDVGGVADIIKDGENGLLVEPQHPDQLASTIQCLLSDATLRERLRKAGLLFASQHTHEAQVTHMWSYMRTVLEGAAKEGES